MLRNRANTIEKNIVVKRKDSNACMQTKKKASIPQT